MDGRACVVVLCSHGINDPLVSTLMLDYMLRVQGTGSTGAPVLFVTEEPGATTVPEALRLRMQAAHITWAPLVYRLEGRQFLQKGANLVRLWWRIRRFTKGYRRRTVVGFLSMAACYAAVMRVLCGMRCICVNFEPHSAYMRDAGLWPERSFKYRFVRWFERFAVKHADVIVAPSTAVVDHVQAIGTRAAVHLQGVTIDTEANRFDGAARAHWRNTWGAADRNVFLYVGKFNGLYHSEQEYMDLIVASCDADPRNFHVIVTYPEHERVLRSDPRAERYFDRVHIAAPMPPDQLAGLLSAGDIGVVAVPPTPSQVFRSPVKTALYWAVGMPILIAEGVSDDWWQARDREVGLVVKDISRATPEELMAGIGPLLKGDRDLLRARCVEAAVELRSTDRMVELLRRLLSAERPEDTAERA